VLSSSTTYCEMCGRVVERRMAKVVFIEGARLTLCPICYSKAVKNLKAQEPLGGSTSSARVRPANLAKPKAERPPVREEYEVVEDFAVRVRKAREALGWTQKALAEAVKESENVIKRIESGRLVPSIDLARRLEKVLNIKLLEPAEEVSVGRAVDKDLKNLTLGDIVSVRKRD